jgi:hypothetical protein
MKKMKNKHYYCIIVKLLQYYCHTIVTIYHCASSQKLL